MWKEEKTRSSPSEAMWRNIRTTIITTQSLLPNFFVLSPIFLHDTSISVFVSVFVSACAYDWIFQCSYGGIDCCGRHRWESPRRLDSDHDLGAYSSAGVKRPGFMTKPVHPDNSLSLNWVLVFVHHNTAWQPTNILASSSNFSNSPLGFVMWSHSGLMQFEPSEVVRLQSHVFNWSI